MAERKHEPSSKPVLRRKIEVKTEMARRLLTRGVWNTAGALYRIEAVWRMIGKDEEIDRMESMVAHYLDKVATELKEERDRLDVLMEQNGIEELPDYTQKEVVQVRILSPSIARYVNLIMAVDEMVQRVDSLWLSGFITSSERKEKLTFWVNGLRDLRKKIRNIEQQTKQLAIGRGQEQSLDQQETEDDVIEEVSVEANTAA